MELAGRNVNGQGEHLTVTIQKKSCVDNQRKQKFPYNAQTMLPTGDIVFGCCRKLKPGEAAVGPEGFRRINSSQPCSIGRLRASTTPNRIVAGQASFLC